MKIYQHHITGCKFFFSQSSSALLRLLELDPVHLDLIVYELVDVGDDSGALDVHEDEAGCDLCLQGRVCPRRAARIDVELALVLVRLKLNGAFNTGLAHNGGQVGDKIFVQRIVNKIWNQKVSAIFLCNLPCEYDQLSGYHNPTA